MVKYQEFTQNSIYDDYTLPKAPILTHHQSSSQIVKAQYYKA